MMISFHFVSQSIVSQEELCTDIITVLGKREKFDHGPLKPFASFASLNPLPPKANGSFS